MLKHLFITTLLIFIPFISFAQDATDIRTDTAPLVKANLDLDLNLLSTGLVWFNDNTVSLVPQLGLSIYLSSPLVGTQIDGNWITWISLGFMVGIGGAFSVDTLDAGFSLTAGPCVGFVENLINIAPAYMLMGYPGGARHGFALILSSSQLRF